tara:strand:+ start:554 stop:736 length:183 start_codon:yes stop_codon:yes gene_type:complete
MKKSKVSLENFSKDLNDVLNLMSKVESLDFGKKIPKKITKEIKKTDKILKEKYKNLDTEK